MALAAELSVRAEQVVLPAHDPGARWTPVLQAEAGRDTWRIVELFTVGGGPFDAELAWSSGSGVGAEAQVTVARATRVAIYARTLRVRARSLTPADNPVGVTVADGQASTRNQRELTGEASPTPVVVDVPPFARAVRLDLADASLLAGASLQLVDGLGDVRAQIPADQQPTAGVRVGGAAQVQVTASAPVPFRLVFDLTL